MRGECYHPRAVSLAFLIGRFRQTLADALSAVSTAAVHARSRDRARRRVRGARCRRGLRRRAAHRAARGGVTGRGDGPGLSQPRRTCRGPGQERRPYRWPGNARIRIHRMRHRHAAAAAGQPEAALVPPARGRGADQSDGIQQRRRRSLSCQRRALALRCERRRYPWLEHRPQFRHAQRARRRRLPDVSLRRLPRRELCDGQHFLAEYVGPARAAGCRRAGAAAGGAQGRAGGSGAKDRQIHASGGQDRARSVGTGHRADRANAGRTAHRWRHRDQHDHRSQHGRRLAARRRGRRALRRTAARKIDGCGSRAGAGARRRDAHHRRRRHHVGRGRAGKNRGGRDPWCRSTPD